MAATVPSARSGLVVNASLNFAHTAVSLSSAIVVSVVLARALGPDRFGLYSLVASVVTFTYVIARFGISNTVMRYVAELDGRLERDRAAAVAGWGLRRGLLTVGVGAAAMAMSAPFMADFFKHWELRGLFLLGAASLVPMICGSVLRNVLRGVQLYRRLLLLNLATSPLWVAACTLTVSRGGGIAGVLVAGVGVELVNVAYLAWWVGREVGWPQWRQQPSRALRSRLAHYNLAMGALVVMQLIVWQRSELVFLGRFSGPAQVAYYSLPVSITERLSDLIPGAVVGVLVPGLTYVHQAGDPARFGALLSDAFRYVSIVTLPLCLFGMPLASTAIRLLYGTAYSPAAPVLQILMVAAAFTVLGEASSSALLSLEAQGWLLKTGLAMMLVNLALDLLLIPTWGAIGAALANTASQVGWALLSFKPLWNRVELATRRAVGTAAVAAAMLAAALWFSLLFSPSPLLLFAGGGLALGVYAVILRQAHLLPVRRAADT